MTSKEAPEDVARGFQAGGVDSITRADCLPIVRVWLLTAIGGIRRGEGETFITIVPGSKVAGGGTRMAVLKDGRVAVCSREGLLVVDRYTVAPFPGSPVAPCEPAISVTPAADGSLRIAGTHDLHRWKDGLGTLLVTSSRMPRGANR